MKYIKVKWTHSKPNEYPSILYSELDDELWEVRKVEMFGDGHQGYASDAESLGDTELGIEPLPPLAEIASDPQFELIEITKEEFEEVWSKREVGGP